MSMEGGAFGSGTVCFSRTIESASLASEASSTSLASSCTTFLFFFSLFLELGAFVADGVSIFEDSAFGVPFGVCIFEDLGVPFGDLVGVLSVLEGFGVNFFAEAPVFERIGLSSWVGVSGADFFIFFELEGGILILILLFNNDTQGLE
jgi:hypothetical protein